MGMDKFIYKENEVEFISKEVAEVKVTPLLIACQDLGIRQRDYLIMKNLLNKSERRILEVIKMDSVSQCRLYITEMVKYLNKRKVLPSKYQFMLKN